MKRPNYFSKASIDVGGTYGKLKILSKFSKKIRRQYREILKAKCSCGNIVEVQLDNIILSPHPMCKECWVVNKRCCKVGDRFDKLLVIGFKHFENSACKTKAHCRCDCGNEKYVRPDSLKRNKTNDCGCVLGYRWKGYKNLSLSYFNHVKRSAFLRNINFSISIEYLSDIFESQKGLCALTGIPILLGRLLTKELHTASVDRIDNTKGYIEGNVWWVHKDINTLKTDFQLEKFMYLCTLVSKHAESGHA